MQLTALVDAAIAANPAAAADFRAGKQQALGQLMRVGEGRHWRQGRHAARQPSAARTALGAVAKVRLGRMVHGGLCLGPRRRRRDHARRGRHPRRGGRGIGPVQEGIDELRRGGARARGVAASRVAAVPVRPGVRRVPAAAHRVRAPGRVEARHRARRAAPPAHRSIRLRTCTEPSTPGGTGCAASSTSSRRSAEQPPALGFNRARSWRPIAVDDCLIHHPRITTALPALRTLIAAHGNPELGTMHLTVGEDGQELLVRPKPPRGLAPGALDAGLDLPDDGRVSTTSTTLALARAHVPGHRRCVHPGQLGADGRACMDASSPHSAATRVCASSTHTRASACWRAIWPSMRARSCASRAIEARRNSASSTRA